MDIEKLNAEIAAEIEREKREAELAEYAPPAVSNAQVNGAKYVWMLVAFGVDIATAYALWLILAPYWWYAVIWLLVGAGGLVFAEWLWERVGNNTQQKAIARTSKVVSAVSVMAMALVTGVALVTGFSAIAWIEGLAVISVLALAGFHGWQSYNYHEVDDDYIAQTLEARAEADNLKELRSIHRAGRRVEAKKRVYITGGRYQGEHGEAFQRAAGKSFASTAQAPKQGNPTHGGQSEK